MLFKSSKDLLKDEQELKGEWVISIDSDENLSFPLDEDKEDVIESLELFWSKILL